VNNILQAALDLHDAGCSVVPARTDGSKAPIGSWKQYQVTRPTRDEVIEWFKDGHEGIGIITGSVSGNLEMLEAEGRAVHDGLFEQAKDLAINSGLEEIWNVLVSGYVEMTPSGGLHFLYRIADEPVPGNTKVARRPGENDSVQILFETRGQGGFVVTAPSQGATHPSGNP
jgi:putative DNA primase/helicase